MVKNTSLKETDGKEKFKRMLSFLKFSGQRMAFPYKIVLRGIRNFHDGRSERLACFERHQAAKFRRVFWYISRYSIVKKITGSSNVGESYGIFTVRFSTWAIFDTQPANEFYLKVCFFWLFNICALSLLQRGSRKYRFYLENSRGRLNGLRATNSDSLARMTDIETSRNQSSKDYE